MKLLFHANRFPYPPFRGDKLKIYNLALELSKNHELHLLTFLEEEEDLKYLPALEKVFTSIHLVPLPKKRAYWGTIKSIWNQLPSQVSYFYHKEMNDKIDDLLATHTFDAVHVQHLRLAPYWQERNDIPRILDLPDAFSLYWQRRVEISSGIKKAFSQWEYKKLKKYEQVIKAFNLALVCSLEDLKYLRKEQSLSNVELLRNGVNIEQFPLLPHDYDIENHIIFTGNMDYAPNVDAVLYFHEEIWPMIQQALPETKWIIAGQRPVQKVLDLANENIKITGFVEDMAEVYKKASIVISPLRIGAGTQNKVLEAMAMGVPVVSRHIGFTGLGIEQGEGVLEANASKDFAAACIQLLKSATDRKAIGEAGQQVIQEHNTWGTISLVLETYFEGIFGKEKS